jgi:hypothetical protein
MPSPPMPQATHRACSAASIRSYVVQAMRLQYCPS